MCGPFYHFEVSIIVSHYLFYPEVHFIRNKYGYTHFSLDAIFLEYCFPPFHFESIFVFTADICLLKAAYGWVSFFDPICYSAPFYWWVQSIYIYDEYWNMRSSYSRFIFCFLVAQCFHCFLVLVFLFSLFWLFFCVFSLWFFLFYVIYFSSESLVCDYHYEYVKDSYIYTVVYFLL